MKLHVKWNSQCCICINPVSRGYGKLPKKISITKKREWLQAYEEGKAEAFIANKDHCDTRTVKKGIEEARRERDASLARADLEKEALRNHNEALPRLIREILPALIPLPSNQHVPWKQELAAGLMEILGSGRARYETWPEPRVSDLTLNVEAQVEWQLLKEHIKRDPLAEALNRRKKALASHLEARVAMKQKLADLLQAKTRYQLVDKPADPPSPHAYSLDAYSVDRLFQPMLQRLLKLADTTWLEKYIIADCNTGEVRYRESALAYVPGKEEGCRKGIINALSEVEQSLEARNVVDTFKAAEEATAKARRFAEEICMLGLLPGQCRICRRLGM